MQQEIDIKSLVYILIKKYKIILLVSVLGLILSFLTTKLFIDAKYSSYASLYVNNTQTQGQDSIININDINASQKLINTYIVILQDKEFLKLVAANMNNEVTVEYLKDVVKMNAKNDTNILQIVASTNNPELSARICNQIANDAPAFLKEIVKGGSAEAFGTAEPASSPSSPNIYKNCILGLFAGFALSAAIVLLMHFIDNTVKDEDDVRERFNIPVLGEVPDFNMD